MNRTKALVLGLFAVYWAFVVVLLVAARNVYDSLLPQEVTRLGGQRPAEIGTLLGERNINIASMQVGRDRPRGDAVMILSVDDPVPENIRAEIRRIPGMADVLTVTL